VARLAVSFPPFFSARSRAIALIVIAILLSGLGFALCFGSPPWWWLGAGTLGAAVSLVTGSTAGRSTLQAIRAWLKAPRQFLSLHVNLPRLLSEVACILLILLVGAAMLGPAAFGDRPINQDHTVHFFTAWDFKQHFLSRAEIRGWTNLWYAGHPVNYLYPPGADLWVIAVHWLSLGLIDFSKSYGLALWLFWCFYGYSIYRLGQRSVHRGVGLAAAVLAMTDVGGARAGGWQQAMVVAVWPQTLAVACAALALAQLPKVLLGRRWRSVALFGLLAGAALLSHPSTAFVFTAAAPLAVLILCGSLRRGWGGMLLRLAAALGIGALLSAAYVLPLAAAKSTMIPTGVAWYSSREFAGKLAQLDGIAGMWRFTLALGLVGSLAALFSRNWMLRLSACLVVVLLAFSGGAVVSEFHLHALMPSFYGVQYERYLILAKPFWFVLTAYAAASLIWAARRAPASLKLGAMGNSPWRLVTRAFLAFAMTALLAPMAPAFVQKYLEPIHRLRGASERSGDRSELVAWLKANLPRDGFYRIGLDVWGLDTVDLGTELPWPIYKLGGTPVALFQFRMLGKSRAMLEAVNVRYLITENDYSARDFELIYRVGRYAVYQFNHWQKDPFVVQGKGLVRLVRFQDELIELDAEPGAEGQLRLNISYFPRWRAWHNGRPVDIWAQPLEGEPNTGFMTVYLKPGHYRFAFRQNALDHLASILSAVGLLAAAFLALCDSRLSIFAICRRRWIKASQWLTRKLSRAGRVSGAVALTTLPVVLVLLAAWKPPLRDAQHEMVKGRVAYDFAEQLARARVTEDGTDCQWSLDRVVCPSGADLTARIAAVGDYSMLQCIYGDLRGKTIALVYAGVPGQALVGYVASVGANTADFKASANGAPVFFAAPFPRAEPVSFDVALGASGKRATVTFTLGGGTDAVCFNAQTVGR
jgi:hypothetical protein